MPAPSNPPPQSINVAGNQVPCADVQLIIAESGLSLSGGEMIIWKRNVLITHSARFVSRNYSQANAADFERMLQLCPHAVGVRPDGSLQLPRVDPADHDDPLQILGNALAAARRELGRQLLKSAVFALLLLAAGITLIVLTILYNVNHPNNPGLFHTAVTGIVLVVASILFFARAMLLLRRRSRIVAALSPISYHADLDPERLAAVVAPSTPPSPNPQNNTPIVPVVLAVLGAVTACCPFVGIIMSAVALALTFRRKSWVRTLAIVALVLSILGNLLFLYMATRPPEPPVRHHAPAVPPRR